MPVSQLLMELAYWLIGLCCLFTLLGFFGRYHWLPDLVSHFRMQYLVVLIAGSLWLAFQGHIGVTVITLIFLVMNLPPVLPFYPAPSQGLESISSDNRPPHRLKVLHINVLFWSRSYDGVLAYIDQVQPDVLSLHEVNRRWLEALESRLAERFPHYVINPLAESALFSKLPFVSSEIRHTTDPAQNPLSGVIIARLKVDEVHLTILVTHSDTPIYPWRFQRQKQHFQAVGEMIQELAQTEARLSGAESLILLGDLNTTPFSANFKLLQETGRLRDARIGFGLRPTWPLYFPMAMIPLDHCLYRGKVQVKKYELGDLVGSDHLPIELELEL